MKQDLDTQRRILHIQGLVYAAQGSLDEAADMARRLKESADTGMNAKAIRYVHHLEGAIASARGNFSQAAENFREALSFMPAVFEAKDWFSLFVFSLAAAEAGAGEKGKARKQFESILPLTSGRLYCGDVYAKAFFELGKLDQEKGDIENARQNYERYLGLLENSDFMYPEKAEAKKRLDSLQEP